ncbi:MAG: bacteriocin [Hydrotalea sp. AMD]|nr:MAG: bacteriocin [Hydrotalea sp. AMD]
MKQLTKEEMKQIKGGSDDCNQECPAGSGPGTTCTTIAGTSGTCTRTLCNTQSLPYYYYACS